MHVEDDLQLLNKIDSSDGSSDAVLIYALIESVEHSASMYETITHHISMFNGSRSAYVRTASEESSDESIMLRSGKSSSI